MWNTHLNSETLLTGSSVPALPASRSTNTRQKPEQTPSHPGGLSADASRRLAEYRKAREAQRNDGITARNEIRPDAPRGLGDFQLRLNRDGRDNRRGQERSWGATPFQDRSGSSRGPNGTWEATPRNPNGEGDGWSQVRNRRWDAPTPRASRGGSPDEIEAGFDMREWEEEQTKLDRDWYMTGEQGVVVSA